MDIKWTRSKKTEQAPNKTTRQKVSIQATIFLLAAAWVNPGRNALQSVEQKVSRTLWSYPPSEVIPQKRNTKTCNKATSSINHPQVSKAKDTEEGSGEITRKAPTPEHDGSTALGHNEGFGETQKEAPTPEPSVREVPSKVRMDMVEQQVYKKKGGH